jgi:ubiquinone/menaquinone biosynthesis C-methylase UbiE
MPEARPAHDMGAYASRVTPWAFDLLVSSVWLPTPIGRLRESVIDLLELRPGMSVLEFGSGTGGITEHLLRRGASVVCVDQSAAMIAHAQRRAAAAEYVHSEVLRFETEQRFERALLAFFLHEQSSEQRVEILRRAASLLQDGGFLVVADSAAPDSRLGRALWRAFVRSFEPPTVLEVVDGALEQEIGRAGLEITRRARFANGRAAAWAARPAAGRS